MSSEARISNSPAMGQFVDQQELYHASRKQGEVMGRHSRLEQDGVLLGGSGRPLDLGPLASQQPIPRPPASRTSPPGVPQTGASTAIRPKWPRRHPWQTGVTILAAVAASALVFLPAMTHHATATPAAQNVPSAPAVPLVTQVTEQVYSEVNENNTSPEDVPASVACKSYRPSGSVNPVLEMSCTITSTSPTQTLIFIIPPGWQPGQALYPQEP